MKDSKLTRRTLLQGGAVVAGALATTRVPGMGPLVGKAFGQIAGDIPAVLVVDLHGGYNALFSSADSFIGAGSFGCSTGNSKLLGNGLTVDNTFGNTMPAMALQHMATIGCRHGLSSHGSAEPAMWTTTGGQGYALMLADALGGTAPIKCAVMGGMIDGPNPAYNGISVQRINDLGSTIAAMGGITDPTIPDRKMTASGLVAAKTMSVETIAGSPASLVSVNDGLNTAVATLQAPAQPFNYGTMAQAYGVSPTATNVNNFTMKVLGAELMITAGANVVSVVDGGWDTHGDSSGTNVRNMMSTRILPPLNVFLNRMLNATGRNVVVAIIGDFARSLPGSDHANCLAPTVIGKYVQVGTTGKVASNVTQAAGVPGIQQFWAYLAAAAHAGTAPFGANPHGLVI